MELCDFAAGDEHAGFTIAPLVQIDVYESTNFDKAGVRQDFGMRFIKAELFLLPLLFNTFVPLGVSKILPVNIVY